MSKKKTIAIIGGTQSSTFQQIANKKGVNITFYDGKGARYRNPISEIERVVKRADCIIVLTDAVSHPAKDGAKELAAKLNIPILFHPSRGATSTINAGLELLSA
ncbi:DUF2325 domain-containing protein [Brevibacillus sp. NPDC003359]|uniref:DUF2325 domain-containing protein n=1 Tax=unclassified Brevibacillus TaxID=2684853 RepID=UPI0036A59DF7